MAIKSSTSRLLAFLYYPKTKAATQVLKRSYGQLGFLLPELSNAGRRSLVAHAVKQGWVRTESDGTTQILLTELGRTLCEREFPAFKEVSGEWVICICTTPPATDKQFRFLRLLLLKRGAVAITRAIYLLPVELYNDSLISELLLSYRKSVVVLALSKWLFGDERQVLFDEFLLSDISEISSGISKELNGLLKQKIGFSDLNSKQKQHLFSVFDRLYSLIYKQMGIYSFYFPTSPSFTQLWATLQELPSWNE